MMNFNFLKNINDVKSIDAIFNYCNNAQSVAITMPTKSVINAKKAVNQWSNVILQQADLEQPIRVLVSDTAKILADPAVHALVDNEIIIDALKFIDEAGNRAENGEARTKQEAIEVLKKLHFAIGESARNIGFIENYPPFEQINLFSKHERDIYYENKVNDLINEYNMLTSGIYVTSSHEDRTEMIEFTEPPIDKASLKPIQAYFGYLGLLALKSPGLPDERELNFSGELTLYGEKKYTVSNLAGFIKGVLYDLPKAKGFKITTRYSGPTLTEWFRAIENRDIIEFNDEVQELGQIEDFTYKYYSDFYNSGEIRTGKFENGEWLNLKEQYTSDILDKSFGEEWQGFDFTLNVYLDDEKYSDTLESLRQCVRKHIPEEELEHCEDIWDEGSTECLCCGISWHTKKLREIQDFLDEINHILDPIKDECFGVAEGEWYLNEFVFGVASCDWTEAGFNITGTIF